MTTHKILQGDVKDVQKTLPDSSINLIVTSPPYYAFKPYSESPEDIENSETYELYIQSLDIIIKDWCRLLHPNGRCCVVIDDKHTNLKTEGINKNRGTHARIILMAEKHGLTYKDIVIWQNARAVHASGGAMYMLGCLDEDTNIILENGIKKIKDVQPEDRIFTMKDGKLCVSEVTHKIDRGLGDCYRLSTDKREIVSTDNHMFYSKKLLRTCGNTILKTDDWKWNKLRDLKNGDFVLVPSEFGVSGGEEYVLNKIKDVGLQDFNINNLGDFFEILGMFIGDGWISHTNDSKTISLCIYDDLADLYIEKINTVLGLHPWKDKPREKFTFNKKYFCSNGISFVSRKVVLLLQNLGFDKKSKLKEIPNWVFRLNEQNKLALLRGYIDADGCVENGGRITVISASRNLIYGFKYLCESVGIFPSNVNKNREYYNCRISPTFNLKLKINKTYSNGNRHVSEIPRPYHNYSKKVARLDGFMVEKIRNIEKLGIRYVYDLSIKDSDNFLAENIVVHNSFPYPPNIPMVNWFEYILIFQKPGKRVIPKDKIKSKLSIEEFAWASQSIWQINNHNPQDHPAPFCEEIPYRLIKLFSFKEDTVLDPFLGSGTTSVVAKKLGRNSIGIELNPTYVKMAQDRLNRVIGSEQVISRITNAFEL